MNSGIYFSDWFDVDSSIVENYGALDISLINDLPLFIDPFLLFNSEEEELNALHDRIIEYMRFLRDVSVNERIPEPLLLEWFTFSEIKQTWLGFSLVGNKGRGLGRDFAKSLVKNLRSVFRDFGEETVTQGSHLEKLCLIKDGVGRDNISDFTTNLIVEYLAEYTQEFAQLFLPESQTRKVALPKIRFNYKTRSWVTKTYVLPYCQDDFVLLTPRSILKKDESWINRPELLDRFPDIADSVPDSTLRAQVNDYLRRAIPENEDLSKSDLRAIMGRAVERFPGVLDFYIRDKEESGDQAQSLANQDVEFIESLFIDNVKPFVVDSLVPTGFYGIDGNTHSEAMKRVLFLKDVVENKGGHQLFYIKGKAIEREKDLRVLFRLVWFASPSDLSAEVNDGRGPVDFAVSRGGADKTLVEFKLAKNTQLKRNLEKQCKIYEAASDATGPSIKVIFYFTEEQLERVNKILMELKMENDENVVLVDACADNKPSGSRA